MEISEILAPEAVYAPIRVQSKKRLFQEIAQSAATRFGLDETTVMSVLQERESLGPTGVGRGVALPHGRIENTCAKIRSTRDAQAVYSILTAEETSKAA